MSGISRRTEDKETLRSFSQTSKAAQQTSKAAPQANVGRHDETAQRPSGATVTDAGKDSVEVSRFTQNFSHIPVRPPEIKNDGRSVLETAERGVAGSGGAFPYLTQIQQSFGRHDISGISAHQDSRAAAAARSIGARAYTTGGHVAFAGAPDLHTAAHEAAHVVQQRGGVQLAGDVGRAGDIYERHADAVAALAVKGSSSEALLDRMAPAGSRAAAVQRQVVQRTPVGTDFGEFDTTKYNSLGPAGSENGVDIELTFDPDRTKVDATKIGLTQSVRTQLAGSAVEVFPVQRNRRVQSGAGEGSRIDQLSTGAYTNPLYATGIAGAGDKLGDTPTQSGWGQHGWNYKDGSGALKHQEAISKDNPSLPGRSNNSGQEFESAAVAVEGTQAGTYMGSVSWGWSVDGAGKFSKLPLTLKSKGNPSAGFLAAAAQWNKSSSGGTVKTIADPTNVYDNSFSVAFTVAKDTEVQVTSAAPIHDDMTYDEVTIKAGPKSGSKGRIKVNDLQETGGTANIKLPVPETGSSLGAPTAPQSSQSGGGLPGWAIALLAVGGAAVVGGAIGLGAYLGSHH